MKILDFLRRKLLQLKNYSSPNFKFSSFLTVSDTKNYTIMQVKKPKLYKLAEEAIIKLAKEGINCTPEEVIWLNFLAERVVYPTPSSEISFLDMPVKCGNTFLYPLTIGARLWLEEYGIKFFAGTGVLEELVFAFAMAHSKKAEIFNNLTSCWKARLKVLNWACKIKATRSEINEAIARCISKYDYDLVNIKGPEPKTENYSAKDYGDCIALLCHFYGNTPSYWLWEVSEKMCAELLRKITLLIQESQEISSDKLQALGEFKCVVAHIKEQHKRNANSSFLTVSDTEKIDKKTN